MTVMLCFEKLLFSVGKPKNILFMSFQTGIRIFQQLPENYSSLAYRRS